MVMMAKTMTSKTIWWFFCGRHCSISLYILYVVNCYILWDQPHQSLEDCLINGVLYVRAWGPDFNPQQPCNSCVHCTCNLSIVRTNRKHCKACCPGMTWSSFKWEMLLKKMKLERNWGRCSILTFFFHMHLPKVHMILQMCACTQTCEPTHTCIHVQKIETVSLAHCRE